jgi:hypothetical protein
MTMTMTTQMALLALVASTAGCSKILGIGDLSGPGSPAIDGPVAIDGAVVVDAPVGDAPIGVDAAPGDAGIPATINVSGDVVFIAAGARTCMNCAIHLIRGNQMLASSVTDPNGHFLLSAPTGGAPLDVSLFMPGHPELDSLGSRTYFPAPLRADRTTSVTMYSQSEVTRLSNLAGENPAPNETLVVVHVRGADGYELAGATVALTNQPTERIHYGDSANDPLPLGAATSTAIDGVAYAFGAKANSSIAQATKPGVTISERGLVLDIGNVVFVDLAP